MAENETTKANLVDGNLAYDASILEYVYQQLDNFEGLTSYVVSKNLRPSTIFLPQTLKQLHNDISVRMDLLLDAIDFLDVVKLYSLVVYNDPEYFTDKVIKIIIENRFIENMAFVLNKEAIDDFVFKSKEDLSGFIRNNKSLLSIYICSLVLLIFFEK